MHYYSNNKFLSSLLYAILDGFGSSLEADDLITVSVILPHFRLRLCADKGMRQKAKNLVKNEMSYFVQGSTFSGIHVKYGKIFLL